MSAKFGPAEAAREKALKVAYDGCRFGVMAPDELKLFVLSMESALDAYAHELAEEQRAWAQEDGGAPEYGSIENVLEAADLIDPEVLNSGG